MARYCVAGHHREKWQDQAMYIGLRYPGDVRKRRRHRKPHSGGHRPSDASKDQLVPTKPGRYLEISDDCLTTARTMDMG